MPPRGILLLLALTGCGSVGGLGPRFEAAWTGSERGRIRATATAMWCQDARIAQLTATKADTGVAVLLHPSDSLKAGRYPIVEPAKARASAPASAVALRLLGSSTVVGYQSESGTLTLERVAHGRVWGRFESQAKAASVPAGTITLMGRFSAIPLAPGGGSCPS